MSNETKRDVFVNAIDALADAQASGGNVGHQDANLFMAEYENALPDDLPVIPEAVDEHIRWCKGEGGVGNVSDAMDYTHGDVSAWLYDENNSDTFALAWVLGVWEVKETRKVVKL